MGRTLAADFLIVALLSIPSTCFSATYYVPDDFFTIQAALDGAINGDTIVVRDGVRTGAGNRNLDFRGKGITLRSKNGPENCIIDCRKKGRGFYFHTGESTDSVVDGFTIVRGSSTNRGGAFCCINSSPTIINCRIAHNSVYGGMGSSGYGGGIYCDGSFAVIRECLISRNRAEIGGGICCFDSFPIISNCTITENRAEYAGESAAGGGLWCVGGEPTLVNCTISGNVADGIVGGIGVSPGIIINSIVWANWLDESASEIYGTASITSSDIRDGYPGEGNIDADPLFVGGGDYHLTASSPCIDACLDAGVYGDIDGDLRPSGGSYDMGSDEYPVRLAHIWLKTPEDGALLASCPTFAYTPHGGNTYAFAVDVSLSHGFGSYYSTYEHLHQIIYDTSWTMPMSIWNMIPSGTRVYWRVRGTDLDQQPADIIASEEVWSFTKQ
jgi:hypothetical protein